MVIASNVFASERGIKTYLYESPQGKQESCIIPKHIDGITYNEDDEKNENALCSYDIYGLSGVNDLGPVRVSVEPKVKSTNPGTLFMVQKEEGHLSSEAKFKQTTSCGNAAAPLAYYHLSRYLGDIVKVKTAVIRTMDKQEHLKVSLKAKVVLEKLVKNKELSPAEPIISTWKTLLGEHYKSPLSPVLFDPSGQFIFGALIDDKSDKGYYGDANGPISSYQTRYTDFQKGVGFKKATFGGSISDLIGGLEKFQDKVQTYQLAKDVSEVILMDTILNQLDRIGNIHYYYYWYAIEKGELKRKKAKVRDVTDAEVKADKSKKKQIVLDETPEQLAKMKAANAVLIKVLTLRDNDCGVSKENEMRKASMLEKVRHMDPMTYQQMQKLALEIKSESMKNFFMQETLMSLKNYTSVANNAVFAAKTLKANCKAGLLKLDLTRENVLNGTSTAAPCE